MTSLDRIEIEIGIPGDLITLYIDVWDNSLGRKWLPALNNLIANDYHLEKNYCFLGFADGDRDGTLILDRINHSIEVINAAELGYKIDDYFSLDECIDIEYQELEKKRLNQLHRYFEDLQGVSGNISEFFHRADHTTRWHIRQLNLLCHEFESWALSYSKKIQAPLWQRPSQLMCWLNAPRFNLDDQDFNLFGIETLNRPVGGVFVGVNKAVGKHHWEVFCDEGRDSRVGELTTSVLKGQTEAAGDFDIEWGQNPGNHPWQKNQLSMFRRWLVDNGFDPEDKSLTIGHPQVGQVDLDRSFKTNDTGQIWNHLINHLNVYSICTSDSRAIYKYHWKDKDYTNLQIERLKRGN